MNKCHKELKRIKLDITNDLLIDNKGNVESEEEMNYKDKWDYLTDKYCCLIQQFQIQKILLGLDLGENPEYTKEQEKWDNLLNGDPDEDEESMLNEGTDNCPWCGIEYCTANKEPKTQVKSLSDKWFSLREVNGQVVSSLWDSDEEGQIQVLEELLEVLKGIK